MEHKRTGSRLLSLGLAIMLVISSMAAVPVTTTEAAAKSKTVRNQTQLNAALNDTKLQKITIKTSKKASFTIKKGSYSKKTLVVKADHATVTNAGKFKAVKIEQAAAVNEKADGNNITVTDTNLNLNIKEGADGAVLVFGEKNAKIKLVADGKVASVTLNKNAKLSISGKSQIDKLIVMADASAIDIGKNITVNSVTVKGEKTAQPSVKKSALLGATVTFFTKKMVFVNHGEVKNLVLAVAAEFNMSGESSKKTAVVNNAKGSVITTACPANFTINENASVGIVAGGVVESITINSESADVRVAEGAVVETVTVSKDGGKVGLNVDGSCGNVDLQAKSQLNLTGITKSAIAIAADVIGASVNAKVPVEIRASASVSVKLEAGAEGSKITVTDDKATVAVENQSTSAIVVATPDGARSIAAGQNGTVADTGKDSTDSGTSTGGISTGGNTESSGGSGTGGDSGAGGDSGTDEGTGTPVEYRITYKISEQAKASGMTDDKLPAGLPASYSSSSTLTFKTPEDTESYTYFWAVQGYVIDENGRVRVSGEMVKDFETDFILELYAIAKNGKTTFNIYYDMSDLDAHNLSYELPEERFPTSYVYGVGTSANEDQIRTPNDYEGYYVTWKSSEVTVYGPHLWVPADHVGDIYLKAVVEQTETCTYTVKCTNINPNGDFIKIEEDLYYAKFRVWNSGNGAENAIFFVVDHGYSLTADETKVKVTKKDGTEVDVRVQLNEPDDNGVVRAMFVYVPANCDLTIEVANAEEVHWPVTYLLSAGIASQDGFTIEEGAVYYQQDSESEKIRIFALMDLDPEKYPTSYMDNWEDFIVVTAPELEVSGYVSYFVTADGMKIGTKESLRNGISEIYIMIEKVDSADNGI